MLKSNNIFNNKELLLAYRAVWIGICSFCGFMPIFIYFVGKYSAAQTAAYTVVFAITGGLGQIIWGSLSDRVGRTLSFIYIFVWVILGFYFMKFSLTSIPWLIGAQLFVGFATNAPYHIFYAVAYDIADRRVKGLAMGFIDLAFYLGAPAFADQRSHRVGRRKNIRNGLLLGPVYSHGDLRLCYSADDPVYTRNQGMVF